TFSYNARNQLTTGAGSTYTYTARDTLASVVTGGTTVTTTNDAYGQTITQGGQTYTYDALGRIVTSSGTTGRTFTYTGTANTLAGDGTATYSRDPAGGLVGITTGTAGVLAWTDQHTDLVGQFTPTSSALTGSATYGPLGTVVATAGMVGNLGYQPGFTEPASGRVNMGARWYNPATGQFDNRDAAGNSPTPNPANADRYTYANDNPLTNIDPNGNRATDTNADGSIYFVSANPDGGTDYTWGAKSPSARHPVKGRPDLHLGPRHTPTVHAATLKPGDCRDDSVCRRDIAKGIDDTLQKANQQLEDALAKCQTAHCQQHVYDKAGNGDYDWVDRGDGTYYKTDGNSLIIFTDDNRVAAVKAQQQAAEAAQAKAAACSKSFWCRAKQWAEDHADLVGAIAGVVAGVLVGAACTALSGGTLTLGCAVLAGAIGGAISGAVSHGLDVAAGRADGGLMGWVSAVGIGAAVGAIGGAVGFGVGSVVGGNLARAGAGLLQRAAAGALTGAVSGAAAGAAGGAAAYGGGCLTGSACTASGFASAVGSG
ncbi:MAG TPA: RHS repeat-associated core domain-containing protein, partial [Pseudonocardiaceae bacterium]|nr:RHS repeat-associated core domain-containing protein [Pseudonocardiaceae bacterium]